MSRQLPSKPLIDVLKKQARQLLNDHQSGSSEAADRVKAVAANLPPAATESFTLRYAQQVIAHEYEFTSWQALVDHVGDKGPAVHLPGGPYSTLADDLVAARHSGHLQSFGRLGADFESRMDALPSTASEDGSDLALEQAYLAVAAQSGCDSPAALAEKIAETLETWLPHAEQLARLEHLHDEFARLIGDRFAALENVKRPVKAGVAFVDQTSNAWFVYSMTRPSVIFLCSMDGLDGDLILDLSPVLADALVAPEQEDRDAQLGRIAADMVSDLEQTWKPVTTLRCSQIVPHSDPFGMGVAPMYETGLLFAFTMPATEEAEELPGLARIFYPVRRSVHSVLDAVKVPGV